MRIPSLPLAGALKSSVVAVGSVLLTAGWLVRRGFGCRSRRRQSLGITLAPSGSPCMDLEQEEVVRALLESDRPRIDELGRTVVLPPGGRACARRAPAPSICATLTSDAVHAEAPRR